MGIIVILIGLLTPAINTIIGGSQVTQSAQLVGDQLAFARQFALAKNLPVEVRFYRFADPSAPGETAGAPSTGKYRAFQFFAIRDTGQPTALGKVQRLQNTVIIDSGNGNPGTTLSSLVDLQATPGLAKTWTTTDYQVALPGVGTSYLCSVFRFLSNGATNLAATSKWFLTIHNFNVSDSLGTPPKNFATIQIEASNGHIRNYRP